MGRSWIRLNEINMGKSVVLTLLALLLAIFSPRSTNAASHGKTSKELQDLAVKLAEKMKQNDIDADKVELSERQAGNLPCTGPWCNNNGGNNGNGNSWQNSNGWPNVGNGWPDMGNSWPNNGNNNNNNGNDG